MLSKIIGRVKAWQTEIVLAVAVVLIAIIAFESGKISASRNFGKPLEINHPAAEIALPSGGQSQSDFRDKSSTRSGVTSALGRVVASKNSTVYHFLWCSGAKRIKEENKITFSSEQEAQSRGYTLASNCQK